MPHNVLTTLFSGVTATQTAPADTQIPVADSVTQTILGVRGTKFVVELDLLVSSGSGSITVDIYLWDANGARWVKSVIPLQLTSTATASAPGSRQAFELGDISPYLAICPTLSAISGTGATVTCRAASR